MDISGFIVTALLLALMPGPDIFFVLSQGVTAGRKPALAVSAGLASGLIVHTAAAALGLSLIISRSPVFLQTIKYAGVAYLAYLGFQAFLSRNRSSDPEETTAADQSTNHNSWGKMYRVGITMNLLNPKVILFFLALFPQFLNPESATPKTDIFLLGGIFILAALAVFSAVSVLSGLLSDRLSGGKKMPQKTMAWINAVVYWTIALVFLVV